MRKATTAERIHANIKSQPNESAKTLTKIKRKPRVWLHLGPDEFKVGSAERWRLEDGVLSIVKVADGHLVLFSPAD